MSLHPPFYSIVNTAALDLQYRKIPRKNGILAPVSESGVNVIGYRMYRLRLGLSSLRILQSEYYLDGLPYYGQCRTSYTTF